MLYKLTDANMQTYGGFQWRLLEWAPKLSGEGPLCNKGHYHAYTDPLLAAFLDPIHANFGPTALLFELDGILSGEDHGLKVGTRTARLPRQIELVWPTTIQRVAFGILCAMEVYRKPKLVVWANNWLSGKDRSYSAAVAAYEVAYADAEVAYVDAAAAAFYASYAATVAAVARSAAANAAANAADYAANASVGSLDLIALAKQAMQYTEGETYDG